MIPRIDETEEIKISFDLKVETEGYIEDMEAIRKESLSLDWKRNFAEAQVREKELVQIRQHWTPLRLLRFLLHGH